MEIQELNRIQSRSGRARHMRRMIIAASVFVIALIPSLQAQTPAPASAPVVASPPTQTAAPASPAQAADDYIIGADDILNVYIVDVPELSRTYRVTANGTVTIPVLPNPITVTGLTLSQFSERLSQELKAGGLVTDPHVTTSVDQSRLHTVAITGAVRQPQIYPLFSQTTLLDLLSQAGGLADDAGGIAIVRRGDIATHVSVQNARAPEKPEMADTVTIDLKRLLESSDSTLNIRIYPGDRITIPRAGVVYVVGAVNKPGGYTIRPSSHGMTVLQAIALAEDTKTTALRDQTVIIRNDPQAEQGRKQIPIDLKKILRGKSPDATLQAEDILFVPDSAGKRALNRGLESVLQAATGVAIYSSRF
jgi:polysaccharide export outer membrane protein